MKLLVTGSEGQLARSLLAAPKPPDMRVIAAGRSRLDMTCRDMIAAVLAEEEPEIVVNSAAYTAVDQAESDPESAMALNAEAAGVLAEICQDVGIPLIHVSTDYVFDGHKDAPYTEKDPTGPINVYGRTKLEGEQRVAANCEHHIIVRTSWVYSPYGHNFVATMLRLAGTRPELRVVDDQIGCPTYAPHLADALLAIILHLDAATDPTRLWGLYHAAGRGETTWAGFAREIFQNSATLEGPRAAVTPIATVDYPTPARRPKNSRLDGAKLAMLFGIALPDWHLGVHDCVCRLLRTSGTTSQLLV